MSQAMPTVAPDSAHAGAPASGHGGGAASADLVEISDIMAELQRLREAEVGSWMRLFPPPRTSECFQQLNWNWLVVVPLSCACSFPALPRSISHSATKT